MLRYVTSESVCQHSFIFSMTWKLLNLAVYHFPSLWSGSKNNFAQCEVKVHLKRLVQCLAHARNVTMLMFMSINTIMINKQRDFANSTYLRMKVPGRNIFSNWDHYFGLKYNSSPLFSFSENKRMWPFMLLHDVPNSSF